MTSLKGDLRSIMGTPFGGVGHAVLIFSRVTRAAFNSDSVVLQLHDRIEMPEEADGKFHVDGLDPGPIRIELEGGTVHNHGWNIDLPDEGVWSLTDLVDAQVDWSPAVIGRAEAAAREARDHADRAEAGADRVGTAEQVGVWASEASASATAAASAESGSISARNASQSARDAAQGHANRAATSESNAKTSESAAKQSETNAGGYAAVATTAATEAVDAMESASGAADSIAGSVSAAAGHADRAEQYESGAAAYAQNASDAADRVGTADQIEGWVQQAKDAADRIGTAEQVEGWVDDARNSASSARSSESKAKEHRDAAAAAASSAVDNVRIELGNIVSDAAGYATESSRSAARAKTSETNAATHSANSLDAAERAEFAAEETIQQVAGDFATRNYVDTAKWDKGYIPDSIDLNNWTGTGSWEVSSVLAGRLVNAPDRVGAGRFEQAATGGGSYTQRYTVVTASLETRVLARTGVPGGNWNQWAPVTNVPEWVPSGADLATMTSNGVWVSPSATWSNGLSGLPENAAGKPFTLKVETSRTTASAFRAVQRLTTLPYAAGEPPITFERSITGDGIHVNWQENTAMSRMTAEFPTAHRVEVMKQASRLRRGGVVGTSGRVPVALSFDHGFTKFQSLILPHLIRLGLPCTVAVNPDTLGSGESEGVGFADLQNWSLNHGIEIAHHGRDHGDVAFANASRLREKLLSTIPEFKTEMPEVISDAFIMPGASGTFYAGFDAALDPEKWWTHAAGRMIDDNFAVVTSALEGQFVPVTGAPVRAVDRMSLDSTSFVSRAESDIRSLVGTGLGVHVFAHPNVINQEGRTSAARLVSFLEFLASLRDAGEIEVLTVSGFAWADTSSDFRMNLAPESNWSSNAATIQVGRIMNYLAGTQVVVETTAATIGNLTMTAISDTGGLNASVTHTATAGGRYRLAFSIPKSATTITLNAPGSARSAMIV